MNLRSQLIEFEGWERKAYSDSLTKSAPWTIGVGHTGSDVLPSSVWSDQQISDTLDNDIEDAANDCRRNFPWFDKLNEPRQAVLIGMCFQMGINRLLGFKQAIEAIRDERWHVAGECLRQSIWAHQTPKRAIRMSFQLETGEWQ